MRYDPRRGDHGLPFDPIMAVVAPRPIGWISTLSKDGVTNLAPYSFFNLLSKRPPIVGYSCDGRKDTLVNIQETGAFVCNMASFRHMDDVNRSSEPLPHGHSEFDAHSIPLAKSREFDVPRVADVACALECRLISTQKLKTLEGTQINQTLVLGQVVGVYIDDCYIVDGRLRLDLVKPLSRCGYLDYASLSDLHHLDRPSPSKADVAT